MDHTIENARARWLSGSAIGAAAVSLLLTTGAAHAAPQATGTAPAAPDAAPTRIAQAAPVETAEAAPQRGLQDIVVTARKRAESVQDIPVSVSAIPAAVIQQRDLTSLEKVAATTPQFTVGRASNGAGAQLTLRGIGSPATSIGVEQSVAIVVDGVYYGQGRIINEGFFDLGRIEILKGPQALFFGKNATAGVVSLTTADPGDKPEYIVRAGYEFGSQQAYGEAIASVPITDNLSIRAAVRGSKMWNGYYKNEAQPVTYTTTDVATGNVTAHPAAPAAKNEPGEKEVLGRLTVKWTPTDRLTINIKGSGDYNNANGNGWNYVPVNCASGSSSLIGANYSCGNSFTIHQNNIPQGIAETYPYSKKDGSLFNLYKSYQTTGTINYKMDDVTLTSITNYNWNSNKFACACDFQSSDEGTWATEYSTFHAFSEEARVFTSFSGPVNLMLGGLYQNTKRNFQQNVSFAGAENSAASAANRYIAYSKLSDTKGETLSGFGQVIWKVVPKVEVTGGVRYTHETKDSMFTQPYVNPNYAGLFIPENDPLGRGVIRANQTFNNWSPEATVSYKPTKGVMLYGAYKTAYKSGGFSNSAINSGLSPNPSADFQFKPEKGRGFEGGIKSTVLDNQLRANLGLYTYKYKDLQVDYFNSQIFAYQTYNAGTVKTKGVELELEYAPRSIEGFVLHGSANYNRARYDDFLAPCYSGQTPGQGCTLLGPANAPFQNLKGKATAIAPAWTATIGASYDKPIGDTLKLGLNVDTRYSGSYYSSSFANPYSIQSAYWNVDAGIRLGRADDRWQVALIGKNLTNKFYILGSGDGPSTGTGTGTDAGVHADQLGLGNTPRTVTMQLTFKY